jgi:hypothetical protein
MIDSNVPWQHHVDMPPGIAIHHRPSSCQMQKIKHGHFGNGNCAHAQSFAVPIALRTVPIWGEGIMAMHESYKISVKRNLDRARNVFASFSCHAQGTNENDLCFVGSHCHGYVILSHGRVFALPNKP